MIVDYRLPMVDCPAVLEYEISKTGSKTQDLTLQVSSNELRLYEVGKCAQDDGI